MQNSASIRFRLHVPAAPSEVFALLATNEGRGKFWCEQSHEQEGHICLQFPDGQSLNCSIAKCLAPTLFCLTYFERSQVCFTLTPDRDGGTELLLEETGLSRETFHENQCGWVSVLLALKAAALGVDLRNHDSQRSWAHAYVDN